MDIEQIKIKATALKSKKNLLDLLNEIKQDDLQDRAYPFTMRQLNYYCNPNRVHNRFRTFKIPKKSGGERTISAPSYGLMSILHYLNIILQSLHTPSKFAMGFVKGRSIVDNASVHINQNFVFNIDLKDFFPSIRQARIWKRLQVPPFNFNKQLASLIAGLCCMKVIEESDQTENVSFVLPQGAPTSPTITNMICDNLDRRLGGLAKRFGLRYSRYADDITFSSMHNVYQNNSEFRKELERIIKQQNFTINDKKTRLQKLGSRQEVTGIIVSNKINVPKKYVREIRQLIYMWEKYGYAVTSNKFIPHYKQEKGYLKKGTPVLENVLEGKLLYLKMIKGENDSVYNSLYNRFTILLENLKNTSQRIGDLKYIDTYSLEEFEEKVGYKIEFDKTEDEKSIAYYINNDKKKNIVISSSITNLNKKKLQISHCDNGKRRFLMIHKPIQTTYTADVKSNISDNLDKTLNDLCNSNFNLDILL